MENKRLITRKEIENRIYEIRAQQVMLDRDFAGIYQAATKACHQAFKFHAERLHKNARLQLTQDEFDAINLRPQIATSSLNYGGGRYFPCVFSEQGIAMLI